MAHTNTSSTTKESNNDNDKCDIEKGISKDDAAILNNTTTINDRHSDLRKRRRQTMKTKTNNSFTITTDTDSEISSDNNNVNDKTHQQCIAHSKKGFFDKLTPIRQRMYRAYVLSNTTLVRGIQTLIYIYNYVYCYCYSHCCISTYWDTYCKRRKFIICMRH